ncbi:hypothetical protein, partial [Methylocystis suflitae]|uniref:hypothetical protein n=1 Tax=Methylocystis suflitae TaxID=2951405 RepID=UPI00210DB4F9
IARVSPRWRANSARGATLAPLVHKRFAGLQAIFLSFEFMPEGACGRDGRPPDSGWLKLTEHRSAISAGGELAIEKSRAAPGEATFAQKNVALYLTMPPGAV